MKINLKKANKYEVDKYINTYIEGMLKLYIASTVNTLHCEFGFGRKRIDKFVEIAFCKEFWRDVDRLNKDGATIGKAEQTLEQFGLTVVLKDKYNFY